MPSFLQRLQQSVGARISVVIFLLATLMRRHIAAGTSHRRGAAAGYRGSHRDPANHSQ